MSTNKLIIIEKRAEGFVYEVTPEGKQCQFLQFLINTSNMTWRKPLEETTPSEGFSNNLHLVSKLCAIGYLLQPVKDLKVRRAVIAINNGDTRTNFGGTGKSLYAQALREATSTVWISGRSRHITEDNFIWDEVTPETKVVVLDDLLSDFNFEFLFANITGEWHVNKRMQKSYILSNRFSPGIFISKDSPLQGHGLSFTERQWYIIFSDYYNDLRSPRGEFGNYFFQDWDQEQYRLFNRLLIECMQLFTEYGYVAASIEAINSNRVRQVMGENFMLWAEEYFTTDEHLNKRIARRDMYLSFCAWSTSDDRRFITATSFKVRLKAYCEWKGYILNPHLSGKDDKSNGQEYITITKQHE